MPTIAFPKWLRRMFPLRPVAFLRGLVAVDQGDLTEAVTRWRQSMELGNKSAQVQLSLASALSRSGDTPSHYGSCGRSFLKGPIPRKDIGTCQAVGTVGKMDRGCRACRTGN